jgi:hypothetical protein
VKPVRTPRQQSLTIFVFDQQININHRRQGADKIKKLLGQTNPGVCDVLRYAL